MGIWPKHASSWVNRGFKRFQTPLWEPTTTTTTTAATGKALGMIMPGTSSQVTKVNGFDIPRYWVIGGCIFDAAEVDDPAGGLPSRPVPAIPGLLSLKYKERIGMGKKTQRNIAYSNIISSRKRKNKTDRLASSRHPKANSAHPHERASSHFSNSELQHLTIIANMKIVIICTSKIHFKKSWCPWLSMSKALKAPVEPDSAPRADTTPGPPHVPAKQKPRACGRRTKPANLWLLVGC